MAVGLGAGIPFLIDAEASGMVRRTVRKVVETRRNLIPDPDVSDVSKWRASADLSSVVEDGHTSLFVEARTIGGFYVDSDHSFGVADYGLEVGDVLKMSAWVKTTTTLHLRLRTSGYSGAGTGAYGNYVEVSPGDGWFFLENEETITEAPAGGSFRILLWPATSPEGAGYYVRGYGAEIGTSGPSFSGSTPDADGWEYQWEGVPNNSTSIAERVEYVDNYGTAEEGAPRVDLTVYNVPADTELEIRWKAAGEQGTVQGLKSWRVSDVGLATDWAAPLNREIVYTVHVDGDPQQSTTVTVHADQSWIQDPLHPDTALPVKRRGLDTGHLTLEQDAAKTGAYGSESTQTRVAGSKYPRFSGSMRGAATDVNLNLFTPDIPTTDDFAEMLADTPILLFRPHERMRPFPGAAYLAADIVETPIDQDDPGHQDGGFTKWEISGNLVQAVMQAVQSGYITYEDVQDLLGGYTYGEVQAAAASTLYLDWQRNPLIFTHL